MSRTRKGSRKSGSDNYPTPVWPIERFLERWPTFEHLGNRWIEPAAGDGGIIRVVSAHREDIEWTACDIRDTTPSLRGANVPESRIYIEDFTDQCRFKDQEFDVAITNPPFRLTMSFVLEMRRIAKIAVVMQRFNYVESDERNEYMKKWTPDSYVLPNRVSYSGDGKADSVPNAWLIWDHEREPYSAGKLTILDSTPAEERRNVLDRRRIIQARDEESVILSALFEDDDDTTATEVA